MCYFQTMTLILIASEVIHISSSELPFLNENLVMWNTSSIADSVLSATMATNTSHLNSTHLTSKSNKFENTSNATASSSENDGKPVRFSLVMFIALVIFIPVTVFGNGFVIIVISLSPYLRSQNTYIYLASLATVDFFIGLVSMPMKAKVSWDNGYFYMSEGACYFYHLFDIFLNTASLLHLFVIAVDRFLAIRYSFKYSSRMTSKLMTSTIISTWILAIVLSLLSIFNWDKSGANKQTLSIFLSAQNSCAHWNNVYFTFIAAVIFLTPLATMLFVYSYLYSVTVSQLRNIAMLNVQDSQHTKDKKLKQQQHRALTSILIIFLVYCICWGPSMIFMLVIFWGADASHWRSLASKLWFEITYFIVINLLTSLNSTTNPFIYVISNKTFRFSCQNVCLKLSRKYLSRHFNLSPIRPSMRLNSYMGSRENTTTNAYPAVSPAELKVESTETLNTVKPAVSLSYFDSTIINTNATGLHFDNSISKL